MKVGMNLFKKSEEQILQEKITEAKNRIERAELMLYDLVPDNQAIEIRGSDLYYEIEHTHDGVVRRIRTPKRRVVSFWGMQAHYFHDYDLPELETLAYLTEETLASYAKFKEEDKALAREEVREVLAKFKDEKEE